MPGADSSETPAGTLFWACAALFSVSATAIIAASVLWRLNPSALSDYVLLGAVGVMEAAVLYLCFLQYQSARDLQGDLSAKRAEPELQPLPARESETNFRFFNQ
jgi:hypothetical protein